MPTKHRIKFIQDGETKYSVNEYYDVELAIINAEGIFEIPGVTYVAIVKTTEKVVWLAE